MGFETDPRDQRSAELTQLLAAALSRIEIAKKRVAELEAEVARLRQNLSVSRVEEKHRRAALAAGSLGTSTTSGSCCQTSK